MGHFNIIFLGGEGVGKKETFKRKICLCYLVKKIKVAKKSVVSAKEIVKKIMPQGKPWLILSINKYIN